MFSGTRNDQAPFPVGVWRFCLICLVDWLYFCAVGLVRLVGAVGCVFARLSDF